MNRFARTIIAEFTSKENIEKLYTALNNHFRNQKVYRYLEEHFEGNIEHFAEVIERELSLSDPLPGTTVRDQLIGFNNQFILDRIHFIKSHIVDDDIPMYIVKDGLPTSRRGLKTYQKKANDILETWRGNSSRCVQAREDSSGDIYPNNPYYGQGDQRMETGIVFCNQSEVGTQRHYEQFYNRSYMNALNRGHLPHEETSFGVSTPAADERLLSRRIFRYNEAGIENGVPRYESRLYRRNLERDVSEGLRNAEKGCVVHGHDMTSLYKRLDYKRKVRQQHESPCANSQLRLYNNNAKISEDMRYC